MSEWVRGFVENHLAELSAGGRVRTSFQESFKILEAQVNRTIIGTFTLFGGVVLDAHG